MRYLRILLAAFMLACLTCIAAPAATAATDCNLAITDYGQEPAFDHSAVFTARHQLLNAVPTDIEVYVHAVERLWVDYSPSVYDEKFREACNPATDYILVALDADGLTQVFYGSHFDRLIPVLGQVNARYISDFYHSGTNKTAAIVNLLDNLRRTFEVNPDYANYHLHEQFYSPLYAPNLDQPPVDAPAWATTTLWVLISLIVLGIGALIVAVIAMMRDKTNHRWS